MFVVCVWYGSVCVYGVWSVCVCVWHMEWVSVLCGVCVCLCVFRSELVSSPNLPCYVSTENSCQFYTSTCRSNTPTHCLALL